MQRAHLFFFHARVGVIKRKLSECTNGEPAMAKKFEETSISFEKPLIFATRFPPFVQAPEYFQTHHPTQTIEYENF